MPTLSLSLLSLPALLLLGPVTPYEEKGLRKSIEREIIWHEDMLLRFGIEEDFDLGGANHESVRPGYLWYRDSRKFEFRLKIGATRVGEIKATEPGDFDVTYQNLPPNSIIPFFNRMYLFFASVDGASLHYEGRNPVYPWRNAEGTLLLEEWQLPQKDLLLVPENGLLGLHGKKLHVIQITGGLKKEDQRQATVQLMEQDQTKIGDPFPVMVGEAIPINDQWHQVMNMVPANKLHRRIGWLELNPLGTKEPPDKTQDSGPN